MINWRRHLLLACSIGLLISCAISFFSFQNSQMTLTELLGDIKFLKYTFFSFVISVMIYAANMLTSWFLSLILKRLKVSKGDLLHRPLYNVVFFVNGILTSVVSYYVFLGGFLFLFYDVPVVEYFTKGYLSLQNLFGVLFLSIFILMIVFVFTYYDQLKLLDIKNKEIEIALHKSQIERMKEQLSPHFLFNNMNVLIGTIQEDPIKAEHFARCFSEIYRYVLEQLDSEVSYLSGELKFIQDYIYLLNVRYDNAIDFQIQKEVFKYQDIQVPTLSLQLLIENVVKHNVIPTQGVIHVGLNIEDKGLVVWNQKYAKPNKVYSSGVGLKSLSFRSQKVFGQDIQIKDVDQRFSVRIPLFKIQSQ